MAFLDAILEQKRLEVAAIQAAAIPAPRTPRRDFAKALRQPGLSLIAEIKRRSPSKGAIRPNLDAAALAASYERGGASAISCLTDRQFFGARADDLPQASAAVNLPVLRKDFVIDEVQLHESAVLGADAVLLIVRILSDRQLSDYLRVAGELGLAALVEVHTEMELDRALAAGAQIIGINNRDLDSFAVSTDTARRLRPRIPSDRIAVAESGIRTRDDMVEAERAGFDAVLIGEALASAANPESLLAELRGP